MTPTELAEILQGTLVDAMRRWNATHLLDRQLVCMPWEELDPVSRVIYIQRCEAFLSDYSVEKKVHP